MFRTLAAAILVLTTVALLSSVSQSRDPALELAREPVPKVVFDPTGAMQRSGRG